MGEFFEGRRKKIGAMTLAVAGVFMELCIRSHFVFDFFEIGSENRRRNLRSFDGNLSWRSWDTNAGFHRIWETMTADSAFAKAYLNLESKSAAGSDTRQWFVPHLWITIPLTLLSAYLLLSKPRSAG